MDFIISKNDIGNHSTSYFLDSLALCGELPAICDLEPRIRSRHLNRCEIENWTPNSAR